MSDLIGFLMFLTIPALFVFSVVFYFLAIGGWRDLLDFLDELKKRRERKRKR